MRCALRIYLSVSFEFFSCLICFYYLTTNGQKEILLYRRWESIYFFKAADLYYETRIILARGCLRIEGGTIVYRSIYYGGTYRYGFHDFSLFGDFRWHY